MFEHPNWLDGSDDLYGDGLVDGEGAWWCDCDGSDGWDNFRMRKNVVAASWLVVVLRRTCGLVWNAPPKVSPCPNVRPSCRVDDVVKEWYVVWLGVEVCTEEAGPSSLGHVLIVACVRIHEVMLAASGMSCPSHSP